MAKRTWEYSAAQFAVQRYRAFTQTQRFYFMVELGGGGMLGGVLGYWLGNVGHGIWGWLLAGIAGVAGLVIVLIGIYLFFWMTSFRTRLEAAKAHINVLERKPVLEILEGNWAGASYVVPIKNHGPGDAEIWVAAIPRKGRVTHLGMVPVEYVRWFRGSGTEAIGTPNKRRIPEGGSWDLHLVNRSGKALLEDDSSGWDVETLAANPSENCNFRAAYGSEVEVTLQAFGTPPLGREMVRTVVIKMPDEQS